MRRTKIFAIAQEYDIGTKVTHRDKYGRILKVCSLCVELVITNVLLGSVCAAACHLETMFHQGIF
jgi:hypothetical protein